MLRGCDFLGSCRFGFVFPDLVCSAYSCSGPCSVLLLIMAVSTETAEVVTMLGMVDDVALLEEIAQDMGVANLDTLRGNVRGLYRGILARVNSEDFDALDDGGAAFVLAARDKLRVHLGYAEEDPLLAAALGAKLKTEVEKDVEEDEESDEDDDESEVSEVSEYEERKSLRSRYEPQPRKALKLTGVIGKPGAKNTLTLSSLRSQIRMAQARHYRDQEIVDAVMRIMSPRLELRSFFEEQHKLTVKDLLFHLEAHYQKQDAKILFNQLGAAVMADGQSAIEFTYQLMGERDRLINLPKRERGSYSKKLIQGQFRRSLYTGMRNQVARRELKSLLCGELVPTDGEIIEEITQTCMVDVEHKSKLAAVASGRRSGLGLDNDSDSSDSGLLARKKQSKKKKSSKSSGSSQDDTEGLAAELTSYLVPILDPLTARVNSLSTNMEKLMADQTCGQQSQTPQLMQLQPVGHQPIHDNLVADQSVNPQQTQIPQLMQLQPMGHQHALNPGAPVFNSTQFGGGHPFIPPLYYNQPRGRVRGGGLSNAGAGRGAGVAGGMQNRQLAKFRCPKCVKENAVFCNHCKICYVVEHRTAHCPHRDDPSFVPTKNC